MALPGHRATKSKRNRRRAHHALSVAATTSCPKCQSAVLPHHACANCGFYRGKQVVDTSRDDARAMKKAQEKQAQEVQEAVEAKPSEEKKETAAKKPAKKAEKTEKPAKEPKAEKKEKTEKSAPKAEEAAPKAEDSKEASGE